jgi:ABC-type lipoprotein release transport system permease subunit
MSWFHATAARLRLLFRRDATESRMNDEIAFHIEMETERLVRDEGLDPAEARRRALVVFGGMTHHKETMRDRHGLAWLGGMRLDFKLGLRMLAKYPVLTLVGVVGMSVAVAVGSIGFSAVNTFIASSLPFDEGDRVIAIENLDSRPGDVGRRTHLHDLATWREALTTVENLGAYRTVDRNLITPDRRAESVRIAEMTASGFRVGRVPPLLGRYFHDEDEREGAPAVAVIGYDVWQTRFNARSDIVGLTIQLGDVFHTVVGVMPKEFAFPINNRVWTPLRLNPGSFERGEAPPVDVFGRLATGASLSDAQRQIATVGQRLSQQFPRTHATVRPQLLEYTRKILDTPSLAWVFHLVQVAVSLLLVVIGTNVAVLIYARTAHRAGEITVRSALGASRRRIVSQLFMEALVLSSLAASIGVVIAHFALLQAQAVLSRSGGEQLPFWLHFGVTPSVVVYAAGLAVLAAVIVGVVPALKATRRHVHANLQRQGMGGSGMRLGNTWTFLIVAQVAVAVAFLPIAMVGLKQIVRVSRTVIATGEFLTATLSLDAPDRSPQRVEAQRSVVGKVRSLGAPRPEAADDEAAFARRFANRRLELMDRLLAEHAVAGVTFSSATLGSEQEVRIEADTTTAKTGAQDSYMVAANSVDLAFFESFKIPILVGRRLQPTDVSSTTRAVIVNRSFVERVLGGGDPIGRRIRPVRRSNGNSENVTPEPWETIVGVAADWTTASDSSVFKPRMYRALEMAGARPVTITVHMRTSAPESFSGRLRELGASIDPMLRVSDVRALDQALEDASAADRAMIIVLASIAVSVVLLSAAGIYALVSFTITRRRREIGVRAALGAGPHRVLLGVLSKTLRQIGLGIGVGVLIAALLDLAATGSMGAGAFPLFGMVIALMSVVGLIAVIEPALRALKIQPTEALKLE